MKCFTVLSKVVPVVTSGIRYRTIYIGGEKTRIAHQTALASLRLVWGFLFWVWTKWGNFAGSLRKKTGVLFNTRSQIPNFVRNLNGRRKKTSTSQLSELVCREKREKCERVTYLIANPLDIIRGRISTNGFRKTMHDFPRMQSKPYRGSRAWSADPFSPPTVENRTVMGVFFPTMRSRDEYVKSSSF